MSESEEVTGNKEEKAQFSPINKKVNHDEELESEEKSQYFTEEEVAKYLERDATSEEKIKLDKSLDHKREDTRSNLANWLIWLLVGTYLVTFLCTLCVMFIPINQNDLEERDKRYTYTKDIFALLITTQTGLVGSVIGFYFGSNQNRSQ